MNLSNNRSKGKSAAAGRAKARFLDIRRFAMDLGRLVCTPCLILFRIKKIGVQAAAPSKLPTGGVMIVSNHSGFSDPFVIGSAFWYRRVHFLAAETVMKNRLAAVLLRGMGCIKIDRNSFDIEAIKKSVAVLKEGRVLTVFPQGALHRDGDLSGIKSGAVLIAGRAGVPIVPIYTKERCHWYERRVVAVGEPLYPEGAGALLNAAKADEISKKLLLKMEECEDAYNAYIEGRTTIDG